MQKRPNHFMFLFVILAVIVTSAIRTVPVYADDGTTEPPTGESTPAAGEEEASVEAVSPTQEPAVAEPASVSEVLEQLPADTELVVINEAGEAEPLGSTEAAAILTIGDPVWCPEGQDPTPGANGCTDGHTDFAALIAQLGSGSFSGNGIIWVAANYNGADSSQIAFDSTELTTLNGSNLTVKGGWNGTSGDTTTSGQSLVDVSMVFTNWTGNLTLQNLSISSTGDNAGFGLYINNTGNVTLNNVSISNIPASTLNPYDSGNGAIIESTGTVDVLNSSFNSNTTDGLSISTSGNVTLNGVTANSNGGSGAAVNTSAGNVNVTGSNTFTGNSLRGLSVVGSSASISNVVSHNNGTGLYADTTGTLTVANVDAYANNMGGILYTTLGTGAITVNNSFFGSGGTGTVGNNQTGLHIESGSTITLNSVEASDNQNNGAYLVAAGNIVVQNSLFNNNVKICSAADPGLYAFSSGGSITLTTVSANNNSCGAGAVLETSGTNAITVSGGVFNQNGTFGIQASTESGDITLNNSVASYNGIKGAYLHSSWLGDLTISNSTFVENGLFGIFAATADGDVTVSNVTVIGNDGASGPGADDFTDYGANLATATGSVTVTNSTFTLNQDVGLDVVAGKQVTLNNVVADQNGGTDVEVFSITTGGPICNGETPVSINVHVNGGTFTNSGGYGLMVKPGPAGTLTFDSPATFGNNGWGEYLLDLSQEFEDCTCEPEEPDDTKAPLIVEVPSTGGPSVEQDCETYSSTILKLPNGTWVKVGCPFTGFSKLEQVPQTGLPGPLGASLDFLDALVLSLTDGEGTAILNEDGTITITFTVPEDAQGKRYSILFWDPTLKDGKGGWVELPPYEAGTSFQLHADNPDDSRTIVSGVQQSGNVVSVTVDFSGVFVLVTQ